MTHPHSGPSPRTSAALVFALFAGAACAAPTSPDDAAGWLGVGVQGLTSTTELELPPGRYRIDAEGVVSGGRAEIDVVVRDEDGAVGARSRLSVPASQARAEEGAVGSGRIEARVHRGGVTEVVVPFVWSGDRPDSGWNVEIEFGRAPDIRFWTVTPIHGVRPGDEIEVTVGADDDDTEDASLRARASLDGSDEPLSFDPERGVFAQRLTVPSGLGAFRLGVVVEDAGGGETSVSKPIFVLPCGVTQSACVESESGATSIALCDPSDGTCALGLVGDARLEAPCDDPVVCRSASTQVALDLNATVNRARALYAEGIERSRGTFDALRSELPTEEARARIDVAGRAFIALLEDADAVFVVMSRLTDGALNRPADYPATSSVVTEGGVRTERRTITERSTGLVLEEVVVFEMHPSGRVGRLVSQTLTLR